MRVIQELLNTSYLQVIKALLFKVLLKYVSITLFFFYLVENERMKMANLFLIRLRLKHILLL